MENPEKQTVFHRRVAGLLHSRFMPLWLVVVSFFENSILLLPMEPLFIPVMAANRERAFVLAGLLTLGCVLGAAATYWVTIWAYEPLIGPALDAVDLRQKFYGVRDEVQAKGFWALFVIGVTPIPFQLGTVAAGVVRIPFEVFLAAVTLSRGIRYCAAAAFIYWAGKRAEKWLEKYEVEIAVGFGLLFLAIVVGGWVVAYLL